MDTWHRYSNHKGLVLSLLLVSFHSPLSYLCTTQPLQVEANPAAAMAMSGMAVGNTALASSSSHLKSQVPLFAGNINLNGQTNGFLSKASATDFTSTNLKLNSGWDTSLTPIQSSWSKDVYDISGQNSILVEVSENFGTAPPDCYDNLLKKFDEWRKRFNQINKESSNSGQLDNNPEPIIRDAFEQASAELEAENCVPGSGSSVDQTPSSKGDFIYKLLKKSIEIMDNVLNNFNELKWHFENLMQLKGNMQKEDLSNPETQVKILETIKEKAIECAKKKLKIKLKGHATQMGINYLSNTLVSKFGYPNDPKDYLIPIAQALDSNTVSKVGEILTDARFRGAVGLINSNNPMPFTKCKTKQDTQSPKC